MSALFDVSLGRTARYRSFSCNQLQLVIIIKITVSMVSNCNGLIIGIVINYDKGNVFNINCSVMSPDH